MEFITERIVNLQGHQQIADRVCTTAMLIASETSNPVKVKQSLQMLEQDVEALRAFEFVLEHRKISYCT